MKKLKDVQKEIENNRLKKESHCKECPLNDNSKYTGPVFFDCEGDTPDVLIISEGPAGFEQINCDPDRLQEWKEMILNEKNKKSPSDMFSKQMIKMQDFLPLLTNNKILGNERGKTSKYFYWTYTVKCFIQPNKSNISIKDAKKHLAEKYNEIGKICEKYIIEELKCIDPKLIILLGEKAKNAVSQEFSQYTKIITIAHPARLRYLDEHKTIIKNIIEEYEKVRERIMEFFGNDDGIKYILEKRLFDTEMGKRIMKKTGKVLHYFQCSEMRGHTTKTEQKSEEPRYKLINRIKNLQLKYNLKNLADCYEDLTNNIYSFDKCPEMADHGFPHIRNLLELLNNFIILYGNKLSEYELYILILSIYLHDIGMKGYGEIDKCPEVRKNHGRLSSEIINDPAETENYLSSAIIGLKEKSIISNICMHHQSSTNFDKLEEEEVKVNGRDEKVRTKFLTAILRLIDECDIGSKRVGGDPAIERIIMICEEKKNIDSDPEMREYYEAQYKHYCKHRAIEKIKFEKQKIIIISYPDRKNLENWKESIDKAKKNIEDELNVSGKVLKKYGIDIQGVEIE